MTSTLRRPLTFAAHERPMIGDSKFSFTDSDHLGWLRCDGRTYNISDYPLLYKVIGRSFTDVSVASTQFSIPDARGRVPGSASRDAATNPANPTSYLKGDISGAQLHQLTIPEMPSHNHGVATGGQIASNNQTSINGEHTHTISDPGHTHSLPLSSASLVGTGPADDVTQGSGYNTGSSTTGISIVANGDHYHTMNPAGGDEYHNNMQPTIFMGNLFIFSGRYITGVYPYTVDKGVY